MDSRIYICTHKQFTPPENEVYYPLHVGAACHEDLPYERDDSGDNISAKNRSYAELTGQYWVWKNVTCDIAGICHYRRYFMYHERFLRGEDLEQIFQEYDAILPYSTIISNYEGTSELITTAEHYQYRHNTEVLPIVREVIGLRCPEYLTAFDLCMRSAFTHFCNMFICRKDVFNAYSEWLFDIFAELEKRIDPDDYTGDQSRIFGFLGERMLSVWFLHSDLRILELPVEQTETDPLVLKTKQKDEIRLVLKRLFHDLLRIYRQEQDIDLIEIPKVANIDRNRIPVFVCWWQGKDAAPEIIRMCINSIQMNFAEEDYEIHLIDWENHRDYVQFPSWIYEKYESGAITKTHLSDILRFYLLYRYGGMWIDASYLITRKQRISDLPFEKMYTIRGALDDSGDQKILWSGNFLRMEAGNRLARFALNAFYLYWATQDVMIDYFLIDYVIQIAYEELPDIREMLEEVPESQLQTLEMAKILHRRFDQTEYEAMTGDTCFFKLSYKGDVWKNDIFLRRTFYGHLCDQYL